jgi:apolipoprotein N-acyltransferase
MRYLNFSPIVIWIALPLVLRVARATSVFPGLLYVVLAIYTAVALSYREVIPVPGAMYFAAIAGMTLAAIASLVIDRLVAPRIDGWASTLVFPLAWVAFELLRARMTPAASWGSLAYSQYGNLPLMQLAALTGLWGISFLIAWFASAVNWTWEQQFAWTRVAPLVAIYGAVAAAVLIGGSIRLARAPSGGPAIRAASVSFPREMFVPGEVTKIYEGRIAPDEHDAVAAKLTRLQNWFLERTVREAQAGARLVAWPETNLVVLKEQEPAFVERARQVAAEQQIFLAMGMGTVTPRAAKPLENKLVLVDPSGRVLFSYSKRHPVSGWEESVITAGDGRLPVIDTSVGRVATAICFDADFPEYIRDIGRSAADLFILPANDWPAIKESHFEMAVFRAIENGVPIVRAGSSGLSGAFDPWGRVLGVTDHYSGARTMVAQVPIGGTHTLYPHIGDLFGWLCVAGLAIAIVAAR